MRSSRPPGRFDGRSTQKNVIKVTVSRPEPREPRLRSPNLEELEELGDDAIIAQQTEAHLPQKRIVVADESRSVVISEEAPASRPLRKYRVERGEPTLVIRDRNSLEDFRKKLAEKQRKYRNKRRAPYLWAGVALAAFAMGGVLTLVLMRGEDTAPLGTQFGAARMATASRVERIAPQPPKAAPREVEEAPPQVKLEELPVERPRRR